MKTEHMFEELKEIFQNKREGYVITIEQQPFSMNLTDIDLRFEAENNLICLCYEYEIELYFTFKCDDIKEFSYQQDILKNDILTLEYMDGECCIITFELLRPSRTVRQ